MRSNQNRHSLVVWCETSIRLLAGSKVIFDMLYPGTEYKPFVIKYDDYGDSLYQIDTFEVSAGLRAGIIETFTEERPQETP